MALQGYTLPAPSGGLNLVDPIDQMEPQYALELVNIFPGAQAPSLRNGYDELCDTGTTSQLDTLATLPLADGTYKLVATNSTTIYEVSSGTASDITGTTVPTDGKWNTDTFAHRLYMCNGVDNAQVYNGTTVTDITFTGPTLSSLINVSSYKERLYFVEKNSFKFHYGNTQAVGGSALTQYDIQYFMKEGGFLLFAGSWTNQLASTSTDLFFACSSEGEILFYNGSSPADVTTPWGIVSKFKIGKPLGYRAFVRVDNDVWILTEQGIVPISALFTLDPGRALETVGRQINPLIQSYSKIVGFSHMWQGKQWAQGDRVFIVIPTGGSSSILGVYATETGAWTTYQFNDPGACISLAIMDGSPYYASSTGKVFEGETGFNDDGEAITFSGRLAFSFFGSRGNYKAFKDIRPLMRTLRGLRLSLGLDTNFQKITSLDTITTSSGTYTAWGSPWGSPWSSGPTYLYDRYATRGQGHCAAIRFSGSIKDAPLELYGFEIRFDLGGQV